MVRSYSCLIEFLKMSGYFGDEFRRLFRFCLVGVWLLLLIRTYNVVFVFSGFLLGWDVIRFG